MAEPWVQRATGATPRRLDEAEARRALALLADPAAGCELRGVTPGAGASSRTLPGSDLDGLVRAARDLARRPALYVTLNPVPANLGRDASGKDVLSRRWLLVDVDALRPDTAVMATEDERAAALDTAFAVRDHLTGLGWPRPLLVSTGNGYAMPYRVDLPNTKHAWTLCRQALRRLHEQFPAVDPSTFKTDQRCRLPGSWCQKGPDTPQRPHRQVRLLDCPREPVAVSPELLADLAGPLPQPRERPRPDPFRQWARSGRSRAYLERALRGELERVAGAPAGTRNDTLYRAACKLGELVTGSGLPRGEAERVLFDGAASAGLLDDIGEKSVRATIARGLDKGAGQPRGIPEQNGRHPGGTAATGRPAPESGGEGPTVYSLPDLLALDLPEPRWAVPGLLSEGLSILAGKPKLGKSWMALNLALTVAAGGLALGSLKTVPGDVLYLSLEDRLRRVQDRLRKLLKGTDCPASERMHLAVAWPRQDGGGLARLDEWLDSTERPALIVVDVWAKFRPAYRQGSQYEQDYEAGAQVKDLADKYGTSLLLLHHCKKAPAEDVIDEISGTLGLAGSADGLLVLKRARTESEGRLFITGRDVEDQELALEFSPKTFAWKSLGNAGERRRSQVREKVLAIFRSAPGSTFWPKEMAERVEMDHDTVKKELWRMERDGVLRKVGSKYAWPVEDLPPAPLPDEENPYL